MNNNKINMDQLLDILNRYNFSVTKVVTDYEYDLYTVIKDPNCTIDIENIKELLKAKFGSKISFIKLPKTLESFKIRINKIK